MEIDAPLLRPARTQDLARLAKALGSDVPPPNKNESLYRQRLVQAVLRGLRRDAVRSELDRLLRF